MSDLRDRLTRWLAEGYTDDETPLDGYGREIVLQLLAALPAEGPAPTCDECTEKPASHQVPLCEACYRAWVFGECAHCGEHLVGAAEGPVPTVSAEQFAAEYAARSGVTVDWLRQHGREARPCVCDDPTCSGWQMAHIERAAEGPAPEPCGVVGEPEAGRKVCELAKGHDGYHQQGNVRWLGYHPAEADAELTALRAWARSRMPAYPFDHNGECLFCDESGEHATQCPVRPDAGAALRERDPYYPGEEFDRGVVPDPLAGIRAAKYLNPACAAHGCQWLQKKGD